MKTHLYTLLITAVVSVISTGALAQTVPDQNPNYAVSQAKYMKVADSLNRWHSTTSQDTYKAIDWLVDRKEARAERRTFRRQMRLESLRWDADYYDNYNYYPSYRNRWGSYRNSYNSGYYRRNNSFYLNPWGAGYWWR